MAPPISTRYAILLELLRHGPSRSKDLIAATELTLQGVSYHVKQLEAEGLVSTDPEGRELRLTPAGVEALHQHFTGLKAFVDLALSELLPVERCVAVATETVHAGDEVGLFMEEGRLTVRKAPSPSQGVAAGSAEAGHLVVVRELTGVVDLRPADVHLVALPMAEHLPDGAALASFVARRAIAPAIVVASGLEAEHLVNEAGLAPTPPIRFAPAAVARHAAQLGLPTLVICSHDTVDEVQRELERSGAPTQQELPVHRHDLPPA